MPSLGTKYSFCRPAAGKGLPDAPGLLDIFVVCVRAEETSKLTIMVLKKKGKEGKKRNKQLSRERERAQRGKTVKGSEREEPKSEKRVGGGEEKRRRFGGSRSWASLVTG